MHNTALTAADTRDNIVLPPIHYLIGKMGIRNRLPSESHQVGAAVAQDTLRYLRVCIPSNRNHRNIDSFLNRLCR